MTTFAGTTAISGIGQTEFSKDSGRTEMHLAVEAIGKALDDAGLTPGDVDGMVTFTLERNEDVEVARNLGLGDLTFFSRSPHGGGAACAVVQQAAMAVATGAANTVVAWRAFNERSWYRYGRVVERAQMPTADVVQYSWLLPAGLATPASWVAMLTRRYMHEYGATSEDFGRVAVADRAHAATNPDAFFYQRPLTLEEHQASKWIVEPLRLLDCCQESDGAVALVITSVERARDLPSAPAVISAASQGATQGQWPVMVHYYRDTITDLPEMGLVARQLYEQSGLQPDDISCAQLYDAFSPMVLVTMEEFGFCARGEAGAFVRERGIQVGQALPVNTNGGQLGEAYIHGMNGVTEAVRQVRGTAVNQVPDAEHVVATGGTGVPTSGLILSRDR